MQLSLQSARLLIIGLVPPSVGVRSSGGPLRSSGVGDADAVAVDVWLGVPVGACCRRRHRRTNNGEECRSHPDDLVAPAEARNNAAAVGANAVHGWNDGPVYGLARTFLYVLTVENILLVSH